MQPTIDISVGFNLGPYQVDPHTRTLTTEDEEHRLEPKVMVVLLELVRHRGEVVARQELLDAAWSADRGSDEALSRVVYRLRQIFEDHDYIQTVPKVGYRLSADVPISSAEPRPQVTAESTNRLASRFIPLGALSVIFLGVFAFTSNSWQEDDLPRVWLSPITSDETSSSFQLRARALTDSIRLAALAYADQLHPEVVFKVTNERRENPTEDEYVFFGDLSLIPGEDDAALLTIFVRSLVAAERVDDTPLNVLEIPLNDTALDGFDEVRQAVATRTMGYLADELPVVHQFAELQREAFRLLMYADYELYNGRDCGLGAIPLLERSIDLVDQFSRTWAQLAEANWQAYWDCGKPEEYVARAHSALEKALAIDEKDVYANYLLPEIENAQGSPENAYARLSPLLTTEPDEIYYLYTKAQILMYAGFLNLAGAAHEKIISMDPTALASDAVEVPKALFYAGQYSRFLNEATRRPTAYYHFFRIFSYTALNDIDSALALRKRQAALESVSSYAQYGEVLEHHLRGRKDTAEVLLRDQMGRYSTTGEGYFLRALIANQMGAFDLATDNLARSVEHGFFCLVCFSPIVERAMGVGLDTQMLAISEQAVARHLRFAERFSLEPELPDWVSQIHAHVASAPR